MLKEVIVHTFFRAIERPGSGNSPRTELLLHMPGDVSSHLEHGNLFLASKDSFEGIVRIDQGLFLCVLKFVLLDVIPYLFGHFATWKRLRPYNLSKRIVGLNGFH